MNDNTLITSTKSNKLIFVIVDIVIFIGLFIFFVKVCPMVPYDSDDWINTFNLRLPFPLWKSWNPTKVFPETIVPICGCFSGWIVYPLSGNYLFSYTLVSAFILAIMITLMCAEARKFFIYRFKLSTIIGSECQILFLLLFFVIFKNRPGSRCMFTADNYTCAFHYTLSGVLNAIVILWMWRYHDFNKAYEDMSLIIKIVYWITAYFAVFSNLFQSCAIAVFAFVSICINLVKLLKNRDFGFHILISKCYTYLIILVTWIIGLVFEFFGGRAQKVSDGNSIDFITPIRQLTTLVKAWSLPYKVLFAVSFVVLIIVISGRLGESIRETYIMCLFNLALVTIFLYCLGVIIPYLSRIEASWIIWFYTIVLTGVSIVIIMSRNSGSYWGMTAMILILLFFAFYPNGKYMRSGEIQDYEKCVAIDEAVMQQIIEADSEGLNETTIRVPVSDNPNLAWTIGEGYGSDMAYALYRHGVIKNNMAVTSVEDSDWIIDE